MTLFQSIILAIVQGITEFLPISSSGHLVLFQKLFRVTEAPVLFDVLLHLGTLGAILVFFRQEIISLVKDWRKEKKVWVLIIIGSVPAAILGFFLNSEIEEIFNSLTLVGIMWIVFGLLLLLTRWIKVGSKSLEEKNFGIVDALVIGLFQAAALFPGISRSGTTIIGGKIRRFTPETAFLFSFLLAIPAISGATILKLKDGNGAVNPVYGVIAIAVAGVVGYFSLGLLQRTLKSNKFYSFGFYCLAAGFLALLLGSRL